MSAAKLVFGLIVALAYTASAVDFTYDFSSWQSWHSLRCSTASGYTCRADAALTDNGGGEFTVSESAGSGSFGAWIGARTTITATSAALPPIQGSLFLSYESSPGANRAHPSGAQQRSYFLGYPSAQLPPSGTIVNGDAAPIHTLVAQGDGSQAVLPWFDAAMDVTPLFDNSSSADIVLAFNDGWHDNDGMTLSFKNLVLYQTANKFQQGPHLGMCVSASMMNKKFGSTSTSSQQCIEACDTDSDCAGAQWRFGYYTGPCFHVCGASSEADCISAGYTGGSFVAGAFIDLDANSVATDSFCFKKLPKCSAVPTVVNGVAPAGCAGVSAGNPCHDITCNDMDFLFEGQRICESVGGSSTVAAWSGSDVGQCVDQRVPAGAGPVGSAVFEATVGVSWQPVMSQGQAPFVFSILPALPPTVSFDTSTGQVAGFVTVAFLAEERDFVVTASNAKGAVNLTLDLNAVGRPDASTATLNDWCSKRSYA